MEKGSKSQIRIDWRWQKGVQYNLIAKNIITSVLADFKLQNGQTVQEMWETLHVTYEDTSEIKRAELIPLPMNMSCSEWTGEGIKDMQKCFTHIGKNLVEEYCERLYFQFPEDSYSSYSSHLSVHHHPLSCHILILVHDCQLPISWIFLRFLLFSPHIYVRMSVSPGENYL